MKQTTLFTLIMIIFGLTLSAQNDEKAIVYAITGKVGYTATPGSKFSRLDTGTELDAAGQLKFTSGSSLSIYYDDEYAVVEESGVKSVKEILDNLQLFAESDLAEQFGDYVQVAMHPYFKEVNLTRSGFGTTDPTTESGTKPPTKGSKDGHGNKKYRLVRVQPIGGKLADQSLEFKWTTQSDTDVSGQFKFVLSDASGQTVFEKTVKGNSCEVLPSDYQLEPGQSYSWQVMAADNTDISSAKVNFDFVAMDTQKQLLEKTTSEDMYKKADAATKALLEIVVLDKAGFTSNAYSKLEETRRAYKNNQLVQLMYKAFVWDKDIVE